MGSCPSQTGLRTFFGSWYWRSAADQWRARPSMRRLTKAAAVVAAARRAAALPALAVRQAKLAPGGLARQERERPVPVARAAPAVRAEALAVAFAVSRARAAGCAAEALA